MGQITDMRTNTTILLACIAVLLLVACQSSVAVNTETVHPETSPSVTIEPSPTSSPTPTIEPTATISPTPTPQPDALLTAYSITALFNYPLHTLQVTQTITYPNTTGISLNQITLVVDTALHPGAFTLDSITLGDGTSIENWSFDGIRLNLPLPKPLPPEEILILHTAYRLTLPALNKSEYFSPNPFGYTTRQVNLVNWYPFVPPYQPNKGWVVHNPWYYGEHLVYPMATFNVTLHILNPPETLIVAASSLPTHQEENVYHYTLSPARNFAISLSPYYEVHLAAVGDVTLLGYAFGGDGKAAEAAFDAMVDAFSLYQETFGSYPYPSLSLIEADFEHGMEYQGLVYLSKAFYALYDGSVEGYLTAIAVHEVAHQWWYALVANDQALEPWLDEALCTYSERLFYENVYPEALDWWWQVRVNFYQPEGWVNTSIYDAGGYRPYVNAVYLRGALFLEELRQAIGDEAFFAFLQGYLDQFQGNIVTGNEFFSLLEKHTSTDLSPLIHQYFLPTE